MRKLLFLFMLLLSALLILAACGSNNQTDYDTNNQTDYDANNQADAENENDTMPYVAEPKPFDEWTIEEFGEVIDAAGIFTEAATHVLIGRDTAIREDSHWATVETTLASGARYRFIFVNGEIDYFGEMCACGEGFAHEMLRQPTPPMNIHEIFVPWYGQWNDGRFLWEEHMANVAEFVSDFENVREITYQQFETDFYSTIILWADSPLRDFSFVTLDVAGHYWEDDARLVIGTRDELLVIDYLPTTDAVVLNVAFAHYLIPHAAIIFTDEQGSRQRMFIQESMRGGCFPVFHLAPHNPEWIADWE
jgi:hypothetical protein